MNIDYLKNYITIVEEKSFSKASKKLFIAQPSLSNQVKYLEDMYRTKLMYRGGKTIRLTPSGKELYAKARKIVSLYEQSFVNLNNINNGLEDKINIALPPSVYSLLINKLFSKFFEEYPYIKFNVYECNALTAEQYLNDDNIENTLSFIFLIDKDEEKLNILLKNLNDKMFSLGYNFAEKRCFNIQVQPLVNRKLILVQVIFETEFYEQKFDFSKVLYHVTFFNKLEKIRKNGLVPYSKSYKFDYPERVYLFNNSNEEIILKYAQQKCKATNNNYACILKISSEKLQYSNLYKSGKITFYIDTMFKTDDNDCNALFTYNNIPKDLISDYVLKIEFDNTFNIIKTEIIEF